MIVWLGGRRGSRAPDFIRPVAEECLLCHSGQARHIPGTLNEYEAPAFTQEAISCERCHGDPTQHLLKPVPGSAIDEGCAVQAWLQAGRLAKAVVHLERALKIDPLYLPVAEVLTQVYRQEGDTEKLRALAEQIREAMGSSAPHEEDSQQR